MAVRVVEWKKPYTWGKAISIDENKVISLNLRADDNLIIYDEWDNEIYVDLQLPDWIVPTDAFPIWCNVGRVSSEDGWDVTGTIFSFQTTSGDNIKLLYWDDNKLYIDNWTWTFKQIYLKWEVDALLLALRQYIDTELAKKQNGVVSDTEPSDPSQWDLWYDTVNNVMKVYDGTQWNEVGTGGWSSTIIVTLESANWSSKSITVSATWVTASNTVIISPDPAYMSDYTTNWVYCSAQWSGTLTFECDTEPSNDIDVNVVILN